MTTKKAEKKKGKKAPVKEGKITCTIKGCKCDGDHKNGLLKEGEGLGGTQKSLADGQTTVRGNVPQLVAEKGKDLAYLLEKRQTLATNIEDGKVALMSAMDKNKVLTVTINTESRQYTFDVENRFKLRISKASLG